VEEEGSFELYQGHIVENSASAWGGGIAGNGSITIYGGEIRSNSAYSGGGRIHVETRGRCRIKGGVLAGNVTRGGGGAITVMAKGELAFMDGLAFFNQAKQAGKVMMIDGTAVIAGGYIKGLSDAENERITQKIYSKEMRAGVRSADCAICLQENGHLTLSGGKLVGPIGALRQDQIVDARDPVTRANARMKNYSVV
jgi:hypothetical protein